MDFGCIDGQNAPGVVEGDGDLRKIEGPPRCRPVEDDVRHLFSAEIFDALLAEYPLNGVYDVGFSGAIWPNNGSNPRTELKPGPVGKAFKAHYFQRFKHISQILTPIGFLGRAQEFSGTCRIGRELAQAIFPRIPDSTIPDEVVF